FEEENTNVAAVLHREIGDGAGLGDLFDGDRSLAEGLVGQVVVHTLAWLGVERKYRQSFVADGIADPDLRKCNSHGWPPWEKNWLVSRHTACTLGSFS